MSLSHTGEISPAEQKNIETLSGQHNSFYKIPFKTIQTITDLIKSF